MASQTVSWLPDPIITHRLVLRPTRPGDGSAIARLFMDPDVRRYLGGPMSPQQAEHATRIEDEKWGHFLIEDRHNGTTVGTLSFAEKRGPWELSYQLAKEFWGRGLAMEGVTAALEWFFAQGPNAVIAITEPSNERSVHLLTQLGGVVTDRGIHRGRESVTFTLRSDATNQSTRT